MVAYENGNCKGDGQSESVTDNCHEVGCQCGKPEYCDYAHFTMFIGGNDEDLCEPSTNWVETAVVLNECFDFGEEQKIKYSGCDKEADTLKATISHACDSIELVAPTISACELGMDSPC